MKKLLFSLLMLCSIAAAWAEGTGDGTKEHPFTGEWQAIDLASKLKVGDYLAYNCVIKDGTINVYDSKLNNVIVVPNHSDWAVGDAIDDSPFASYNDYCTYNSLEDRKGQSFIIAEVTTENEKITMTGYYSGLYLTRDADGFLQVGTATALKQVVKGNNNAHIKLTADIYLNDCPELCNTFTGILDGNNNTIYAGNENTHRDGVIDHGKYLFVYSVGATFRNLTFKDFRADTDEHSNWSILTSQATNGCVFENITFNHVSVQAKVNNVGAAAGYAQNCTFTNITVLNSDFTVSDNYVGTVVGDADGCTFTNIEVNNCETTADDDCAGGVVGHARNCSFERINIENGNFTVNESHVGGVAGKAVDNSTFTDIVVTASKCFADNDKAGGVVGGAENGCKFTNIEIKSSEFKLNGHSIGGVAGNSNGSEFKNCKTDEKTCVFADGNSAYAYSGGISGWSEGDKFYDCVNSALVTADQDYAGGIVGYAKNSIVNGCLNTGMVMGLDEDYLSSYYSNYRQANFTKHEKYYKGAKYVICTLNSDEISNSTSVNGVGGIVGKLEGSDVIQCANLGSPYSKRGLTETPVGGIVGETYGGENNIIDCLSDFLPFSSSDLYSIYGVNSSVLTVKNCLSLTQCLMYYDLGPGSVEITTTNKSNNYMLFSERQNEGATAITESQLASGELCALLGEAWEQNPGDPYPTPTVTVFSDNIEYNYNYYSTTGSVVIKRTFADDGWYSLCLPFNVDATQTAEKFAQVAKFREVDGNTYRFTTVDHIEAGKPYIVKVKTTLLPLENPKFTNVTIAANVTADKSGAFVGVLKPTEVNEGDLAIGTGETVNPMHKEDGDITIKAFRAYFPQTSANAAKAMRFTVDDGEATVVQSPIEATDYKLQTTSSFNLAGQKVDENYRGIVIKNGKKVLVK